MAGWTRQEQGHAHGYTTSTHTRHFPLLQLSDWIQGSTEAISLQCQFFMGKGIFNVDPLLKRPLIRKVKACSEALNAALVQHRNCHLRDPTVWTGIEEWCQNTFQLFFLGPPNDLGTAWMSYFKLTPKCYFCAYIAPMPEFTGSTLRQNSCYVIVVSWTKYRTLSTL